MRYVRSWAGIGALLMFAGGATAQPGTLPGIGASGTSMPLAPIVPPGTPPTASPAPSTGQPVRSLSALSDDSLPVKDLTPAGFGDLLPPPDKHGGHGEIPGSLTPMVPQHGGFYTTGEFLLMRPRNSDMDFVIRNSSGGLGTVGPIDSLNYQLGSGLRAEIGYLYDGGKWETAFAYTYLTAGADSTIFSTPNVSLLPTLTRPGLTDRALTASGTADLDYQLFDLLAGRRFVIQDNFAVRAIAGFRFSDIRQTLNAFYDGADANQAAVRTRSRFQGFGPLIGAEATLAGPKGFHLYTRATGGFLSGRSTNLVIETNDSGATTYVNSRYDVRKEVPFGSLAVGAGWQYRTISIRAGYEVTHWQGIFERPRFVDDVSQGKVITRPSNLSLEGLFIQASVVY
ncbi:hypothetical protein VT84_10195 [Gemmata sp. SH-PL17]|uniref:Lpg1974 family pore-forming outer membrane protein n=1 Tax=Gemmata sp. SH-PL17 TaxID=1630693 RepID=UPI0006980F8A|nr:Lpg1974 family pore-forming outer membrane protein [Gemmata sp. SH-PL17]AMV24756.1 hypothetical protein VT84_10195 [Gemmata sp. SH-PL17]